MIKYIYLLIFLILTCPNAKSQVNWIKQTSGTMNGLTSVCFKNDNEGYAIGNYGTILKTIDGGLNWKLDTSNIKGHLTSVCTIKNKSYIVGYNSIQKQSRRFNVGLFYKGNDSDKKWSLTQTSFGVYSDYLNSVYFTNLDTGYIVGLAGLIIKTKDGGQNWEIQNSVKSEDSLYYNLNSVYFINSNEGFAVGNKGMILKTVNGGLLWTKQESNTVFELMSVYFTDLKTGYAVGGDMWEKEGVIIKTTDGGINWVKLLYDKPRELYYKFNSVFFINPLVGYAVGSSCSITPYKKAVKIDNVDGLILKTTDGGRTWIKEESGVSNSLASVCFTSKNIGYVVGDKGIILKTAHK